MVCVRNYMKAGRSQWGTVLAMYCCLLVALYLDSTVLKFLFAIFSILQGSSLLCFSVLMNDEVRYGTVRYSIPWLYTTKPK